MTPDDLRTLSGKVDGCYLEEFHLWGNEKPCLVWSTGTKDFCIKLDDSERPAACFDLLDLMEAAGHRICLQDRLDDKLPRAAYTWLVNSEEAKARAWQNLLLMVALLAGNQQIINH